MGRRLRVEEEVLSPRCRYCWYGAALGKYGLESVLSTDEYSNFLYSYSITSATEVLEQFTVLGPAPNALEEGQGYIT